jgi:hypothetical protein
LRRFDPTDRLVCRLIRLALALASALAAATARAGESEGSSSEDVPIALAADRVRYWDEDGRRWVWLEGRVTVEAPGGRTVSAERGLARLGAVAGADRPTAEVEIYVEGGVTPPDATPDGGRSFRLTLRTTAKPRLRSKLAGWPPQQLASPPEVQELRARAFASARAEDGRAPDPGGAPDPAVERAQISGPGFNDDALPPAPVLGDPIGEQFMPNDVLDGDAGAPPGLIAPPTDAIPLPEEDLPPPPPRDRPSVSDLANPPPLVPGTRRTITIIPRSGGRRPIIESDRTAPDGSQAILIRGGVNVISKVEDYGMMDLAAESMVIWTRSKSGGPAAAMPGVGGTTEMDADQPIEIYLEGDVIIRMDEQKLAGSSDQRIFEANQAYVNLRTQRVVAHDAEFKYFSPGLIAPMRTTGELIHQYRPATILPDGKYQLGPSRITADRTSSTGSRFPQPGYRFNSRSVDITQVPEPLTDPYSGGELRPRNGPTPNQDVWVIDARQNAWFIGPVPVFYWPRIVTSDDFNPPIRNFMYRYGSYFGHQVLLDWSPFKLLGWKKPTWIDTWNLDTDYLSMRGPALGTEVGWFGRDLVGNLIDPYNRRRLDRDVDRPYFGYLDMWGIRDTGVDVLGSGPAVVTYGSIPFRQHGWQRDNVPPGQVWRGRFLFRHMQSLLGPEAEEEDDFRLATEAAAYSDRHFLEQYYKRLWDSGLDQDTKAYLIYQHRNTATTLDTQINLMPWVTDTNWLPKLEYYRIGDNLLNNLFSYSQNSGVDYAKVHTALEVTNPYTFAFLPYDPISNTSGIWQSGRAWTTHEIDMPLKLGFLRVVPYAQGQLMGWSSQLGNQTLGRAWGAGGARANMMAWRTFPDAESELFNVHGLAHKINFDVDYRYARSTLPLSRIGVQDQYDDDTYEFGRRYFAMTEYIGGALPLTYDPRYLMLRRALSPIVFTPDLQGDMHTVQFALHNRLQTKRGPEGRRRIIDYMILDLQTTYYPQASRDNFGIPFGQNMYNFEWFVGDRTSIVSTGWFEFWDVGGNPTELALAGNPYHNDGLSVISAGVSINRPPRGSVYFGYSVINTGPIQTSALNSSFNYWMSPKWYSSFATSYDFGNAILLSATASVTKIGPDFLTSLGVTFDPQRNNVTAGFELAPRFSPNVRLGSAVGTRFDSRFAPTQ